MLHPTHHEPNAPAPSSQPEPVDFRKLFERRAAPRSPFLLRAAAADGLGDFVVEDLSTSGMRARSRAARFPGSLIKLRLEVPIVRETIEVWAKVLELTPAERGVAHKLQFCCLSPKALLALYRLFDRTRHLWT